MGRKPIHILMLICLFFTVEKYFVSPFCRAAASQRAVVIKSAESGKGKVYQPVEWMFKNINYDGNPLDVVAKAVFRHTDSGEEITTELFYDEGDCFKLRFTPTKTGRWVFVTESENVNLNNLAGHIEAGENPGVAGFVTNFGGRWGFTGTGEAFVPQLVMYEDPAYFYNKPERIDKDIKTFFGEHGFNGFHVSVFCRWFNINKTNYNQIDSTDPNPDFNTFEALELLITKVNAAGGFVHIWFWGDQQRKQTAIRWGINGRVDRRLQRYICARLGPLPGWTGGYGFDLQEWVNKGNLRAWHKYMHSHLGWRHLLGGRSPELTQIYEKLDYISYQQHRPNYKIYLKGIEQYPDKPIFFEDRFRIRDSKRYRFKDYNLDMTRRGLWHSTMAGGAANIWGYLLPASDSDLSKRYPNRNQILCYAKFWQGRFKKNMLRDNSLTDGYCLKEPDGLCVFYKQDCDNIRMNISGLVEPIKAVAVDTKADYKEIEIETVKAKSYQLFKAPYKSDWAISVARVPEPVEKLVIAKRYAAVNDRIMFLVGQMDAGVTMSRSIDELEKIIDTMMTPYGMNLLGGNLGVIDWGAWNNMINAKKGKEKLIAQRDYPWQRTGQGETLFGGGKFDLDKFDEGYFDKLAAVVKMINSKGIIPVVGIFSEHGIDHPLHWKGHPFHPQNNINQLGLPQEEAIPEFFEDANALYYQTQYVNKLLETLSGSHYILLPFGEMKQAPDEYIKRWLRVFAQYEERTGKEVVVCISGAGEKIDGFIKEPAVDMIDISYYHGGRYDDAELNVADGEKGLNNTIIKLWEKLDKKHKKPIVKLYFKYGYPYANPKSPWADTRTGTELGGLATAAKDAMQAVYNSGGAGIFFKMAWARDRGQNMKPDQWSRDIKKFVKKIGLYD